METSVRATSRQTLRRASLRAHGAGALGVALGVCLAAALCAAPARAEHGRCAEARDEGYRDGLAAASQRAGGDADKRARVWDACADAYGASFRAGRYVGGFRGGIAAERPVSTDRVARRGARPRDDRLVGPGATAESARRFARCRAAETRLGGQAGAPTPSGCEGLSAAELGARRGRLDRRRQRESFDARLERNRLNLHLLSPSATRAERRQAERRFRALDRAEARRKILRPPPG